jgi:2-keto-4-pentenoate hydratase
MNNTADALMQARRLAQSIAIFPGELPRDIAEAYAIQSRVLQPGRKIGGWKVAMIAPDFRARYGAERIAGPIYADLIQRTSGGQETLAAGVFDGGFSALEAEFAIVIGTALKAADAPFDRATLEAAIASLHAGVEIASSPVRGVLAYGPAALIADLGTNVGAIVGPAFDNWRDVPLESLRSRMTIDGVVLGEGSAASVPGGPVAALDFLAHQLARLGRDLSVGDIVLTGMTTGVHPVEPGSRGLVEFPGHAGIAIDVRAIAAQA